MKSNKLLSKSGYEGAGDDNNMEDDEEIDVAELMGFQGFNTTKVTILFPLLFAFF
jgi:hypothetical protein